MDAPNHKRARGNKAETIAADLLAAEGYQVIERNFAAELGELDIIARDGDVLVFVEVRSRADGEHGDAVEMVGRGKQRRVARGAERYLAARRPDYDQARFDVIGITGDHAVLIKDAFRV
ncbi:MAG: YraN family protein [Kofleriaceae bacterium]